MFGAHVGFAAPDVNVSGRVIPRRDTMTPPDLSRDAPVLDVAHPVVIGVFPIVGHEADLPAFHCFYGRPGQRTHFHEPLVGEQRFDDCLRAVTTWHHQFVRLYFFQQTLRFQIGNDALARDEAVETLILDRNKCIGKFSIRRIATINFSARLIACVEIKICKRPNDLCIYGEDIEHWQVVALANFVVVEIMRRSNFYTACSKLPIHVVVGDDRNLPTGQRQVHASADQVLVTLIFRMHCDCAIAQHGFRARGCDN